MFNAYKFTDELHNFDRVVKAKDTVQFVAGDRKVNVRLIKQKDAHCWLEVLSEDGEAPKVIRVDLVQKGVNHQYRVGIKGGEFRFKALHNALEAEDEEASYTAPMTAKIVKVMVKDGDEVEEGDILIILEAMKLQIEIKAASKQVVDHILVEEAQQVQQGDVLLTMVEVEQSEEA